jgi:hypothetical protein
MRNLPIALVARPHAGFLRRQHIRPTLMSALPPSGPRANPHSLLGALQRERVANRAATACAKSVPWNFMESYGKQGKTAGILKNMRHTSSGVFSPPDAYKLLICHQELVEAGSGIEPLWTDLQSVA